MLCSKLEGSKATELHILSLVDDAHAAATEFLNNAVMGNGLADHGCARLSVQCYEGWQGKSTRPRNPDAQMPKRPLSDCWFIL